MVISEFKAIFVCFMILALCQAFCDSFEILRSFGLIDVTNPLGHTSNAAALLMEWPQQQGYGSAQVYGKW